MYPENLGDKVLNMVESVMQTPLDGRAEVMEMCLQTSETGDYQPVELHLVDDGGFASPVPSQKVTSKPQYQQRMQVRTHVPGRAGGGWDDSDDGEGDAVAEQERQLKQLAEMSVQSSSLDEDAEEE